MGTRADFYVGTEWLGSLALDGYRIHEMREEHADRNKDTGYCWKIKTATTEADYRKAVSGLLRINEDATLPEHGWPWPWDDSRTTDRAYVFDGSSTRCYAWGKEIDPDDDEAEGPQPEAGWPDMSSVKNEAIGTRRDSIIVISAK